MTADSEDFSSLESTLLSRVERLEDGDNDICRKLYDLHKDAVWSKDEAEDVQCQRILRFSSGWWGGDPKTAFEGKGKTMKLAKFKQTLVLKTMEWFDSRDLMLELNDKIEGPGIFVFQHKTIPCLRYVSKSTFIVNSVQSLILGALAGTAEFSPVTATFLCSQARDWIFYFRLHGDLQMLDNHENEAIFAHNSLWPFGLNMQLNMTATTLPDIRRLCIKHNWPPSPFSKPRTPDSEEIRESFKQKPIPLEDMTYTMFKRFIVELKGKTLERFDNEVNAFHDVIKTLKSRFNSFEDEDADNLDYACVLHKEMLDRKNKSRRLAMKRDLCLKSGWWGLNVDTAIYPFGDKYFQLPMLVNTLAEKSMKWYNAETETEQSLARKMHKPGVYVFQHKKYPHFRYVGQSDDVLGTVRILIYRSLVGCCDFYPLAAMLLSTRSDDWYFYFVTVDDPSERDIKHNDLIIRHDALWPNGLNREFVMNANTLPHFPASCARYKWPKERDGNEVVPMPSLVSSDDDIAALSRAETPADQPNRNLRVDEEPDDDRDVTRSRSSAPRSSDSAGGCTPDMSSLEGRIPCAECDELRLTA